MDEEGVEDVPVDDKEPEAVPEDAEEPGGAG
jgi:hypothetical protein